MAVLTSKMWKQAHEAFLAHDLGLLAGVLKDEERLNALEKEITEELIQFSRTSSEINKKQEALAFADVVGDLELIGDYCKDILERVEIKIQERLLFSEEAVREYEELYKKTSAAIDEIVFALERDSLGLVKEVLRKEEHIDSLVDDYRRRHNQRLIDGVCTPMACNMYLNILDFTAAVYYHAKKIAKSLLKIEHE